MAERSGEREGQRADGDAQVGVADPGGDHADEHFVRARVRELAQVPSSNALRAAATAASTSAPAAITLPVEGSTMSRRPLAFASRHSPRR
jgi:hypothetical protein